ncbi:CinA family protein [Streptomyces sp. NPDC005438]|uniref:CinA family protein n=1 Tax=Streptomyces sp. NPDC005438 TaxID=3156880 RepID=UPI0033A77EA0
MNTERPSAADVLRCLRERGETLAAAESLTGGLLAAALTGPPGASQVFRGSVTAYATDVKHHVLGVDGALLDERGAVDPDVARAMARGVRELLGADWGVATTGVAGPDPQDGQPVGTVFVAVAGPDDRSQVVRLATRWGNPPSREHVRSGSVEAALELLDKELITNVSERVRNRAGGWHVCSPE